MRLLIGLAVLVALAWVAIFWGLQQKIEAKHALDPDCRDESILLDVWRNHGVINPLEQQGDDVIVNANLREWQKLSRDQQVGIGIAAYCAVRYSGKHGVVHLRFGDDEFAQVANGRWYSKRYPE